jgi:two-component system response regulator NreC
MSKLRVLLADDHALMREGLRKILEEQRDWEVIAQVGDGRTAVRETLARRPDVAVLDIGMPLLNGIEATAQIARRAPTPILILSMHCDEAYVSRAIRAGARGYLLKDSAGADLIGAVEALAAGRSFFSAAVSNLMVDGYVKRLGDGEIVDRYEALSEREREIFQLVAEGRSTKEIADLLSISPTTVETHRGRILQKLELRGVAEVVLYAVRRGIVS